ncbi:MAG: hypothetical protein IH998_07755 [Proteobacteria bacterium]|nr:hypothetical protein [Pseudomonadota bacterium]
MMEVGQHEIGAGRKAVDRAAGLSGDGGVPRNLKANDPGINQREFKPPEIEKAKEVDDNREYMQQKMMMLLLQAVLTGIMGPMGGMIGGMMTSALQMNGPSDGNMNKVNAI